MMFQQIENRVQTKINQVDLIDNKNESDSAEEWKINFELFLVLKIKIIRIILAKLYGLGFYWKCIKTSESKRTFDTFQNRNDK